MHARPAANTAVPIESCALLRLKITVCKFSDLDIWMQPYGNIPCSELKLLLADTTMDLVVGADDNSAAAASSGQSSEKPAAAQPKRTRKETKKDEIAHARSLVGKIVRLGGIDGVVQQVLSAPKEFLLSLCRCLRLHVLLALWFLQMLWHALATHCTTELSQQLAIGWLAVDKAGWL